MHVIVGDFLSPARFNADCYYVLLQDEDPETSWMMIEESDLIAIFSQFPFDAIFKHLLKMDPNTPSK